MHFQPPRRERTVICRYCRALCTDIAVGWRVFVRVRCVNCDVVGEARGGLRCERSRVMSYDVSDPCCVPWIGMRLRMMKHQSM